MPTDRRSLIALFLFAHQDDEFGVFAQIEWERRAGRRVRCIYVTDGAATADPDRRDDESRAVLQRLGVAADDILFVGRQLGICDGQLHARVDALAGWLDAFLDAQSSIVACFVPAWEGGHPDHDLLHAVAVRLLAARDRLAMVRQYPLYHGHGCAGPLFRVLAPLPENGPVDQQGIAWRDRLRYLRLCLAYPSQWRSWVGLFPFVCLRYLCAGVQQLQTVDTGRLEQRPHEGSLYYERRAFLDWSTLHAALDRSQSSGGRKSERKQSKFD
jgi:LmbE family N-acetylglucosaminyl deacetylase